MTRLRPDFETVPRFLGRASRVPTDKGFNAPVLVGGAAIELYSNNVIATGDFDIAAARQQEFEAALIDLGLVRPSGAGKAVRGWMHPDFRLGFEVVSSTLLDGLADRDRVRWLDLGDDGTVCVLAIEDMIADRMGFGFRAVHAQSGTGARVASQRSGRGLSGTTYQGRDSW